ncbi:MAG TPA: HD domain-containing protein [Fimbriimonadaceae bacterium]|nr:HD domain-containing protein [Fimbriimonadaceae bacterium]
MNPSIEGLRFTDATTSCLEALRRAAATSGGPIERHSARVFFIMEALARSVSAQIDREVAACAALLHDIGLYDAAARPHFYLRHGRISAQQVVSAFRWEEDRLRRCLDAIERHHRLTPQWDLGEEVELLRLADLVDASRGTVTLGLDRRWLRWLFSSISRRGLQRELLRHSMRGAPCITRGLIGTLINAPRRQVSQPLAVQRSHRTSPQTTAPSTASIPMRGSNKRNRFTGKTIGRRG